MQGSIPKYSNKGRERSVQVVQALEFCQAVLSRSLVSQSVHVEFLCYFFLKFVMDKTIFRNKRSEGGLNLKVGNLVGEIKSGEPNRMN